MPKGWQAQILKEDYKALAGKIRRVADHTMRVVPSSPNIHQLMHISDEVDRMSNEIKETE